MAELARRGKLQITLPLTPNEVASRASLASFVKETSPWTLEPWQHTICERLERLLHETGQRILVHGPPQFGKSIIISQRFPAWLLGQQPLTRVRLAAYNITHAERFSKINLDLMRTPEYQALFTGPACRVPTLCPAEEWSTAARAAQRDAQPSFRALGIRSGFVGLGADLVIIDDPYASAEEAFSEAVNGGVWRWWTDVVLPRLNPATNVVVMFHRWHEDDLAGRLKAGGGWEYLRFPAIADGEEGDESRMPVGEPLSPRFSLDFLHGIEAVQGQTAFRALFQGTPMPGEGALFKRAWLSQIVDAVPAQAQRVRYWDKAATPGGGDYSCAVRMARAADGIYYVEDVVRGQWSPADRQKIERQTAELDGLAVAVWMEQEGGSGGKESALASIRNLAGFSVRAEPVSGDKRVRAMPFAAQCEVGNVRLVQGEWNRAYIDELCAFPFGKYDDQVDASSGALNKLAGPRTIEFS